MIFTLLTTLVFYTFGAEISQMEPFLIQTSDISLDWSTKTISLDEQTLILTKHYKTYESIYQIELSILDIYKNELIKRVIVGNQNSENYHPQIIIINNFIYIVYVNQELSIVKLGLKKYDMNLVEQQIEHTFGDSLESAKFDQKQKYIQLTPLNSTAFSILWRSRGQSVNQYQWNYINYNTISDTTAQVLSLQDSFDISIAQNKLGIIGIIQIYQQAIYITKIENEKIIEVIKSQTNYYYDEYFSSLSIFSQPNGEFIIYLKNLNDITIKNFDRQLYEKSNFQPRLIDNNFCNFPHSKNTFYQHQYQLFIMSVAHEQLCFYQFDFQNQSFNLIQQRSIKKSITYWMETYIQRVDEIAYNKFSLRWLTFNKYKYELNAIKLDMNIKQNECKQNCKQCDSQFKCLTCSDGYTLISVKNECIPKCPDNCDFCNDPTFCIKCKYGFQHTSENLCITPQNDIKELRISDEQITKGKLRISLKNTEILILYSLQEDNKETQLVLKKLNSQGILIKQIIIDQKPNQILDFDISSADDIEDFHIIIKRLKTDSIVQIIDYKYDYQTMEILNERILDVQSPLSRGKDQVRIIQLKNKDVYYFYQSFDKDYNYYQIYYLRIDDQGTYNNQILYQNFYEIIKVDISVSQNSIYINVNLQQTVYQYQIELTNINYLPEVQIEQYNIIYDSASIKLDYDKYLNQQIFMNFIQSNPPKILKINQLTRKIKTFSSLRFEQSYVLVVWIGYSNVELENPVNQIYIQNVNLQTQELTNFKEFICSKGCASCNDQGICLECKNTKYELQNGKCVLTCESNCELCEIENQCLQCVNGFYLNQDLLCDQTQQQDVYQQDNVILSSIVSQDDTILQISLKKNNQKFDIVFEEYNRQGLSKSGEIKISDDSDIVLFVRPKILKINNQIVIQYVRKNLVVLNIAQFVILSDQYQQINRFTIVGELFGDEDVIDFIDTDDLKLHIICTQYLNSYWEGEIIYLKYVQYSMNTIGNPQILKESSHFLTKIDNKIYKVRNIQIKKNMLFQKLSISYTFIEDNIESIKTVNIDENLQFFFLDIKEKIQYYINNYKIWIVSYEKINSNLIKVKFYNENQEMKQEHTIESYNQLNSFQIQSQSKFIYFIYTEQSITSNNMNIQIIKYSLNGDKLNQRQINHNELIIQELSSSSSDDMLYLTWSSFKNNRIFKVRLNSQLNTIPFVVEQICNMNCEICDTNLKCKQCSSDYSYNETYNKCEPICAQNCQSCRQPYSCDYCNGNAKFINQKCTDISQLQVETSICQDSCYGMPSIIAFSDYSTIYSYQKYENSVYKINVNINNNTQDSILLDYNIIIQDQEIAYHKLYLYEENQIALIWLSGNCQIQCRLMLQLFQQDWQLLSNPYELRIMKIKVNYFNFQIQKYNNNLLFLWTELDQNDKFQTMLGQYDLNNGFSLKFNINENENDESLHAKLIIQSGYYQIIYIKNNFMINSLTVDGSINSYRLTYTSKRPITSLAVSNSDYYGMSLIWVENEEIGFYLQYYYIQVQSFDSNFNPRSSHYLLLQSVQQITQLSVSEYQTNLNFLLTFVIQELNGQYRIRYSDIYFDNRLQYNFEGFNVGNVLSQYNFEYGYHLHQQQEQEILNIMFSGFIGSSQQLFYQNVNQISEFVIEEDNCFQRNSKYECIWCKQGYYLFENQCELQLPQHCVDGDNGICEVCDQGYLLTIDNVCLLENQKYKEMRMNTFILQSKQRITTFKNGDYVTVWQRQYYENQGTGVFMSMFNGHGINIQEEKRISLSSAGIQIYPDVQALDNDQFCAVWIEGDLKVQAKIKLQRFTKDFVRIGDEIIVQENVQLKQAQRFDTPLMIQSIINGYVIVWTQNHLEQNRMVQKLHVAFYNQQDIQQGSYILNNQESIRNSEPVVTSNDQIIVIVWQSDSGIIASKFSLNYLYITQEILSKNGQAPSINVLSDNKFIIAWRDTFINSNDIMSQTIMFRKYSSDLNTQEFNNQIIIQDHNLNNPDILSINNGFVIIFENRHALMSELRNLKMQIFNIDGYQITHIIDVFNELNQYPHHPQLTQLPQGEFLVSWTLSKLEETNFNDDLYMKRYNSNGIQLPMDTIVCPYNCKECNQNDICLVCINDYVLNNNACHKQIAHCLSYTLDSVDLICQTCETEYKLTHNICYQEMKQQQQQQLNVEFVNEITSRFAMIKFKNSDILFIWQNSNLELLHQRFDQYGKQYYLPKQLNEMPTHQRQGFDACEIENNLFVFVYSMEFTQINVAVYDNSQNFISQTLIPLTNNQYWGEKQQLIIVKYLGNNKIAIVYQEQQGSIDRINLNMVIFKLIMENGNTFIQQIQQIIILQAEELLVYQSIDVEIIGNNIKIWIENIGKSEIRYIYKTYDFFGNLLKTFTKKNDNIQIEFKIVQLQDGSFLEVWTEINYSQYEVYYVIKKDNQNIFEPYKLSSSQQLYKLDLKTYILSDSIAVIWREGSFKTDMSANTIYKAVLISKQNYQQVTAEIQLNQDSFVKQGLDNFMRIIELPNQDIIIGWISYNFLVNYNAISVVKLNKEGQLLQFSEQRCSLGCQECTNLGKCLQCYDQNKYKLDSYGNCIIKQERCQNYQYHCQDCLDGYYQNRYLECNEIKQNVEIDVMEINSYSEHDYQIASYKNGTFVVVQKSDKALWMRVFNQEAIQIRDFSSIIELPQDPQIGSDYYIIKFQILIDDQDVITICYLLAQWPWQPYLTLYIIEQYDNQLNRIGDIKMIPLYVLSQQSTLTIKYVQNNQIGIAIKTDQRVIFSLYSFDLKEIIGNSIISTYEKFEFVSNGQYILGGYIENQCDLRYQPCTIIKVYDKQLRFIKDIQINDAQHVKMTINNEQQFIVLTQNQINVIDNASIIKSKLINTQSLIPIKIFVNSNNELVIFSQDEKEAVTLLLTYFSLDGQIKTEVQVNMKKIERTINSLFQLQNKDIIILFSGLYYDQSAWTNKQKIRLARFDEYGKSLSLTQIICPQNCEECFQTTTCNICKSGYNRNPLTLLCEKICTIEGCKSCEYSNCDYCKEGMFLSFSGVCEVMVQDSSIGTDVRYTIPQIFASELKKKILKFSNNEFALIYISYGYIKITRFNAQGQELMFADFNVNDFVAYFDAVIVNNQIYFVIVTNNDQFTYKVYNFVETTQQFNQLFTNQLSQFIKQIKIIGFKQNYIILVDFQDYYYFEFGQLQCLTQSLYFYNELNLLLDSKLNFNIPSPYTQEDCNINKINNFYIYQDILYIVNTRQTSIRIIAMNSQGQSYGENILEIPNIEQIEFTIDQEQIIILFKETGTQIWNLRIMNTQYQPLYNQDNYLKGDLSVDMVTTQSSIIITWSQMKLQSVVEYVILDRLGQTIKSTYIRGQYSQMPLLTELDNQIVCLIWSVWINEQQWTLSYSLLDKTGEQIYLTHINCPQNCQQCSDSSTCQQCQDGYDLMFYQIETYSKYSICSKKCDPFCQQCDFGRCYRCQKNYYVGIDGICIWNEFENKSIQLNEFSQFSQVKPNGAKFKDGSILIAWSSNNEDEDSWGVFAQLLNSQGQKIGNNFRVSQSVFGAQHSPQVAVLEDDTAIITFIEGNPQKEAIIKGIRFNNRLETIGNEQLFTTFSVGYFELNSFYINKIVSLKNGGFVIIWSSNNQINLQFYDSASNLVIQTQILDTMLNSNLEVAVTITDIAILYRNTASIQWVCIYTQDGVQLFNQELFGWENTELKLISISHYFALGGIVYQNEQQQIKLQFYNNQFTPQGIPIIIATNSFQQYSLYVWFERIELFSLHDGALLILQESRQGKQYRQFYIDINWQVSELLAFGFNIQDYYSSQYMKMNIISHINSDQYFLYWNGMQQQEIYGYQDTMNIYIQRLSKSSQIIPIDQIVCSNDCISCDTQNTCSQCLNQYSVQNQKCIPQCESNCQICLIPKKCEVCFDGYYQKVQGKCSPIPVNYQEPQLLMNYPFQSYLMDQELLPNGQTIFYTQQTLFDQQQEIFTLYLYQDNQIIKQMSVQTNTLTTNYFFINPYYFEDNYYLIFHMVDGIKIIKFNALLEEVLNTFLQYETIDSNIDKQNQHLIPIENNQYSLLYFKWGQGVFRILLDETFNVIQKETLFEDTENGYGQWRNKNQIIIHLKNEKLTFTNSKVIQQTKQVCSYSQLLQSSSCDIYQLQNGNKIQIFYGNQNLNYHSYYGYESSYQIFYRVLDNQDIALTTETLVLENTFQQQSFAHLFVFQDSFTIIIEKKNNYYFYENIEIYSQRFDNSGLKIGEPQFILFNKDWQRRFYKQTLNGYIIYQENRIYIPTLDQQQVQLIYKQYDELGNVQVWSTNKNCIANCDKCINSYYCEQCSQNYQLDSTNKCKLTCETNCNQCSSYTNCESCDIGYKLISGQCVKIVCVDNCSKCLEDTTTITTTTTTTTICQLCNDNYYLSSDSQLCIPQCPSNCSQCTIPLECETCAFGYVVTSDKKCQQENSSILDQIKNTTVGTPLMATFPDGSYILMWYQNGDNAGVYFQLYSSDNVKVGDPMKVTGNTRRLLNQQSIIQNYYADIIAIDYEFFVTWMDASAESTDVKLKKFSSDGTAQTQDLLLGTHQKTDLQDIKIPCQIKKTTNNSLLIAYMAKTDNQSDDFSMFISSYDSFMNSKTQTQEIKKVNQLAAPSIVSDENGIISLTYQSDGYVFVQQITEDGNLIDTPKAIADSNSINLRVTNLENGIMVFLWENKNLQLSQPQFILNYQLISKDLKTRSEVKSVGDIQIASLTPDIQSFNEGFIIAWKITDSNYKSIGLEFQIFDSMGMSNTQIIEVQIEGIYPQTPRIQIINENQFAVTWTAKNIDSDGTILGDGIFMQKYNKYGTLITDSSSSTDLCSYQCQSCQSPLVCLKCQYGFYLNQNNQCIMDCGAFCDTCEIPWTCQVCKNGYQLNNNEACIETECSEGYFRNTNTKLCEPKCPDECNECSVPNICVTCNSGYQLSDSSCISNTTTMELDDQSTIMAIVIIILAAAFFSVSACSITLYCKYKKLLKDPSYCQVHPVQDVNKSVSNVSCNVSVIRLRQNE